MLWSLRILFLVVLGTMIAITSWAGAQCALFAVPREVAGHPWFVATLADAYWAFITCFVWIAWKERRPVACILWLVSVLALGSMAIATYVLRELFSVEADGGLSQVVTRRGSGRLLLPGLLVTGAAGVLLLA